jgi:hypothetical protein
VKNADDEPTDNPRLARAAMMARDRRMLRSLGAKVADEVPVEINPLWDGKLPPGTVINKPTYFA